MKSLLAIFGSSLLLLNIAAPALAQNMPSYSLNQPVAGSAVPGVDDKTLGIAPPQSGGPNTPPGMPSQNDLFGFVQPDSSGPNVWARTEFLSWWFKGSSAPPLVTTGPSDALPTLDRPGTQVLFGNNLPGEYHPGGRFTVGFGLPSCDPCPTFGFEVSYFFTSQGGNNYAAGSSGTPIVSRPFFNVSSGTLVPVVEAVANPAGLGVAPVSGSVAITNPSRLWGFEANGLCNLCCDPCRGFRVDLIYGFRQLAFDEDLNITENLALQDGSGERIIVHDNFAARNQFYGGQLGLRGEKSWGCLFINGSAKVALGDMRSEVNINGTTTDGLPGFPTLTAPGGLLAQSTNSGQHLGNSFCVIPEAQLNLGCNVTRWLRAYVGYDYLYISQVARPGSQIDLAVNTNLIPTFAGGTLLPATPGGPARPAFVMNRTDFWAQGINVGLEFRW
jgi:hypothetical protein